MSLEELPPPAMPWDDLDARADWYRIQAHWCRKLFAEATDREERQALFQAYQGLNRARVAARAAPRRSEAGVSAIDAAWQRLCEFEDADIARRTGPRKVG